MNKPLLTEEEARKRLQLLCDEVGGAAQLAQELGITSPAISHQLHGHRPIQGKVANRLGIRVERETTIMYREVEG